jgi:hypothetical protein
MVPICILNQKCQFGELLEGLVMEDVGIFYGGLVYPTAIWYFCGHLAYFMLIRCIYSRFAMLYQEKSGNLAKDSC